MSSNTFWSFTTVAAVICVSFAACHARKESKPSAPVVEDVAFKLATPKHPGKAAKAAPAPSASIVELAPVYITLQPPQQGPALAPQQAAGQKKNCYDHDLTHSHLHYENKSFIYDNAGKVRICNSK